MGKDLLEVKSKTKNGTYNIVLGQDYRIYCTCKAWQFSRPPIKECKHLRDLFAVEGDKVMLELQKPTTVSNPDYRCVLRAVVL